MTGFPPRPSLPSDAPAPDGKARHGHIPDGTGQTKERDDNQKAPSMALSCPAFTDGGIIPDEHTCTGQNSAPKIIWSDVPERAASLVLIAEDPDAPVGIWTHWLAYNIPAQSRGLPAGIPPIARLDDGTMQGKNDFRKIGYGGPCPPQGHGSHRYFFRLYALDRMLDLKPGAEREALERAMDGHIIGRTEIMGKYARRAFS